MNASAKAFGWDDPEGGDQTRSVDSGELDRAHVEGYLLVVVADRLRRTLEESLHADLLELLPLPWFVDSEQQNVAQDGASYLRHVRNAHEHDDDDGRCTTGYGFGHAPMRHGTSNNPLDANVGGLELSPFAAWLTTIMVELRARS